MSHLTIKHSAGFFSCCSLRLDNIINFFNNTKVLPESVDSTDQFTWYKVNTTRDVTFDYFINYNMFINIEYKKKICYQQEDQYKNYLELPFYQILPFIDKYFSPSNEVKHFILELEKKYNLDYNNLCVLFYRGNDKNSETKICEHDEYIIYANKILDKNPSIKFFIQSDETEFIEMMTRTFPNNSFYMKDETRNVEKSMTTVDMRLTTNIDWFSKMYLAITIIMSRCKYIVCGSGNCSIWIMFYRRHSKNVCQNLNGKWIENIF